ncbi:Os09g0568050 [Oryza sativa Japonica Group]|uniref:Os09g0568050 protein n=1 Tax=Oryza sativa subsp. japonica TaxID=39947 RepID=A0A0P0XQK0_ORYSJ|nr:hypothetical protein EE612_049554 [Oryza sativa]BAT09485.1 Os09g0568050 [Oryza sativa Japonica Group]
MTSDLHIQGTLAGCRHAQAPHRGRAKRKLASGSKVRIQTCANGRMGSCGCTYVTPGREGIANCWGVCIKTDDLMGAPA